MKLNLKDLLASKTRYFAILSIVVFYLFLLSRLSCPDNAVANGAVGSPGLYGNDIVVSDRSPIKNIIVDEEVVLDYRNKTVSVDYKIVNNLSKSVKFDMVFPINDHRTLCNEEVSNKSTKSTSYEDELNFRVFLNKNRLLSRQVSLLDIKLEGDYGKLRETACYSFTFPIELRPGSNLLHVNYNLIPSISWADGSGGGRYYSYAIWTAKNWVTVFRKALWRVYLPEKSVRSQEFFIAGNLQNQFEDWYTIGDDSRFFNWYKYGFRVQGPGKRIDHPDHIDFIAENFVPAGSIVINLYMHDLTRLVEGCNKNELNDCWPQALQSTLATRPYRGSKNCYDEFDLGIVLIKHPEHIDQFIFLDKSIPFLRNEIYARKGHIFTSDTFRTFFNRMPWYKPKQINVQLNQIEKWNVEFLQEVEKEIKSGQGLAEDTDQVRNLYQRMIKTCPGVVSGQ